MAEVSTWGSSVTQRQEGGGTQTASNHFWLETFYYLLGVTELETPPVAKKRSCTSNATFRTAF